MGTACSQECSAAEMGRVCDAAFNLNAEQYPGQSYSYAEHLSSFAKPSAADLPRLGLVPSTHDPFLGKASNGLNGQSKADFPAIGHESHRSRKDTWLRSDIQLPLAPPDTSRSYAGSPPANCTPHSFANAFVVPASSEHAGDKYVDETVRDQFHDDESTTAESDAARESVLERILLPVMSPRKAPNVSMSPYVGLVFNAQGEEQYVQLRRRPLGAEFNKTAMGAMKISKIKPQSYAEELGLQQGWAIRSIDGDDVSLKTLEETQSILRHALMKLPTE